MNSLVVRLAFGLALCGLARPSLAQTPGKLPSTPPSSAPPPVHLETSGVHPSATVEVLEDPSQVEDVIARMKQSATKALVAPVDSPTVTTDSLQADRPSLPDDTLDKDTERPLTKAEKRAREIERLRRLLRDR